MSQVTEPANPCRHCGGDLVKITPQRNRPTGLGEKMYWWIHTSDGQDMCNSGRAGTRIRYAEPSRGTLEGGNKDGSLTLFGRAIAQEAIQEAKDQRFIQSSSPYGVEVYTLNAVQLETLVAYAVDRAAKALY